MALFLNLTAPALVKSDVDLRYNLQYEDKH